MNDAILVTGAGSGIGEATVSLLLEKGKFVIGCSRKIEEKNPFGDFKNFLPVNLDVSNFSRTASTLEKLKADYDISVLVNNAGITSFRTAHDESVENIQSIINTNLTGAILVIKSILSEMIERGAGTIVNVQSVAAINIYTNSSVYSASKAGLLAYSKVLREEVRENGIRVIDVIPGPTGTAIWPESALNEFGHRMMTAVDVGSVIADVCTKSSTAVPEEIVLRPQLGDL